MRLLKNIIACIVCLTLTSQVAIAQTLADNEYYEKAYTEMADMLDGKIPISIRRAVFMAEWAYLDGNLETKELRRKWNKTKEGIDSIKQNIQIIK